MNIDGYLTEKKLETILIDLCKTGQIYNLQSQVRFNEIKRFSFDYLFNYKDKTYVVEFDGHFHYSDTITIYRDYVKNKYINDHNMILVRIPYWIQLNSSTFTTLFKFKLSIDITTNYPHGFIDKKAMCPANFCKLGFDRFEKELEFFGEDIKKQVIDSLILRSKKLNIPLSFLYK